jgi:hypothetical protein
MYMEFNVSKKSVLTFNVITYYNLKSLMNLFQH